jgi:anti-sigma factor RsiW
MYQRPRGARRTSVARHLREEFPTCKEIVELVTDYLEDRMETLERERFERHIATCDGCERYIAQIRMTIAATGAAYEDTIPADQREGLLQAFRELVR